MSVCKVLLYGLKPCDLLSATNDEPSAAQSSSPESNYLNIDIKPLLTPTSSVSDRPCASFAPLVWFQRVSTSSDNAHESSPVRVAIRQTNRGRYRICVSQTLLRSHNGDA